MANLSDYTIREDGLLVPTYTNSVLLAANVPEFFDVPQSHDGQYAKHVVFGKGAAADFYAQAFTAEEAENKITNGTFAADESWTKGAGWSIAAGVASASTSSAALSQSAGGVGIIAGQPYLLTFTATRSAGSVTASIGGTNGSARSTSATFAEVIIAGSTQTIAFTGSGFTGTIDNVTLYACAAVPGDATAGQSSIQNPKGLLLNGTKTRISVASAGTPIITASFYK